MIFLDSSYFIELMNEKNKNYKKALKIENHLKDLNEPTVINTTILVETLNRSVGTRDVLKQLHDNLRAENFVDQLSDEDYLKSLQINGWFDNSINYSDCTIINTMISMGITKIVSFDDDFEKIEEFTRICNVYW